jgi:quercetin dioxygenase-like cupin family protein
MTGTINTIDASENLFVLGETLRPVLTNAMGSAVEIFDTKGPANAGPPPHRHPWEEVYVVLTGELEISVGGGDPQVLTAGGMAHVPANTVHSYRNVTDAHFLTIVTRGNANKFFTEVSADVEMNPPDIAGIVRVAASHGIEFVR